jgi:hypothetical protein
MGLAAGDFDGDARPDIAVSYFFSNTVGFGLIAAGNANGTSGVSILPGNGDGTFGFAQVYNAVPGSAASSHYLMSVAIGVSTTTARLTLPWPTSTTALLTCCSIPRAGTSATNRGLRTVDKRKHGAAGGV